jgi:bacteriocin biosynthesis cyclodehydratase domain-containing protein
MVRAPRLPRVKPHVAFVPMDAENLLVKGPVLFARYGGEAVPVLRAMLPLLDGTRTPEEIAAQIGQGAQDVRDVLEGLAADKVVEDAAEDEPLRAPAPRLAPQLQAWSHLTGSPGKAQNRVAAARVHLSGTGTVADEVARILRAAGVGEASLDVPLAEATHAILALDAPDPQAFLAMNDRCLAARVPWTGVFLDNLEAIIGPTVLPGQSACWRCYDLRVKGAHPNLERLLRYEAAPKPALAPLALPSFAPLAGASAAQAVLLALAGAGAPPLAGYALRVELLEMRAQRHRVLRIPRCPACSPSDIPDIDRYALEPTWLS